MHFVFLLIRVIVLCGFCVSSWAQPSLLSASAYWVDESSTATFDEAKQKPYTDYTGSLQKGYTSAAVWIKLRINGIPKTQDLVLTVSPSFLRKIELYDPLQQQDGVITPQHGGRLSAFEGSALRSVENEFRIFSNPRERDVYLRIETPTTLIVNCSVQNAVDAENADRLRVVWLTFYLACLSLTSLWGLINYVIQQDDLYGFFALRQLYAGLYVLSYTGLLHYLAGNSFDPLMQDFIYNFLVVTIVLSFGLFETKLLKGFGVRPRLREWTRNAAFLSVVSLVLLALGMVRQALSFNLWVVILFSVLLSLLAYTAKPQGDASLVKKSEWIIKVGYSLFLLVVLLPLMSFQSIFPANPVLVNVLVLPSAVSTILMLLLLAIHTRQRNFQMQEVEKREIFSRTKFENEMVRRKEKENFLSMLIHELRNPLTVIQMRSDSHSLDGQAVQRAAVAITKVLERVQQSERQEVVTLESTKREVDLNNLLAELHTDNKRTNRLDIGNSPLAMVVTDHELLRAMLDNLIDNAFKYSPPSTPVRLIMALDDCDGRDGIRFVVMNDVGDAGLPDPSQVFSKYYRSAGARRQIGSGLGLYLVSLWSRSLGGQTEYKNLLDDRGVHKVVFSIWIPL